MNIRTVLVAGLIASAAGIALADSDRPAPAGSMPISEVTTHLQAQGFTVSKIKFDDGRYKVKAIDSAGRKEKLSVDPKTGAVVSKGDDDGDD
jgi:hypothetical protein